jgi:Na+/melibiose symporter-like transporter
LLLAFSVNALANAIPATLVLFFLQDAIGATSDQASLLLAAYFLSAAVGVIFWSRLAHRIGIILAWRASMLVAVLAFLWALMLGQGDILAFTLICLGTGFALGAELVCPPVLLGRIIDAAGHRGQLESSYFGVWNLVIKMALALSAGLALPALAWLDYLPGQALGSSDGSPGAIHWAYAGLPCILKCVAIAALGRVRMPTATSDTAVKGENS